MEYISIDHPIILHLFSDGSLRPSLMAGYGPYQNLEEARRELTAIFGLINNVPQGYTFCIINNGKPVEYWFYKSGGWFVEPKNTSTSSSSSNDASYLGMIAMKIDDDGVLWLSINGGNEPWQRIGSVRQPADLTKIRLGITGGNLYITYDGSDPRTSLTRTYVGVVGGDGLVIEGDTTYLKFDTDGTLLVKYGEEGSWGVVEGSQYQGNKINESVFRDLLTKYFKIGEKDGYIKYSYDGGINWTELHKVSDESTVGNKHKVTFRVYYSDYTGEDLNTVLLVDNNGIVNGDSMFLESGQHSVTATCVGYNPNTVNFTVNDTSITVDIQLTRNTDIASCTFRVTVLGQYDTDVTSQSTIILNGKEREGNTVTIFSGGSVTVEIKCAGYYDYKNTFYDIATNRNEPIKIDKKPETQESEWTYHILAGTSLTPLTHFGLIPNAGRTNVYILTGYRRNKITGVQEGLRLVRAFNPDGDPNGASMIAYQRPTTASDQAHSPYSIYMELVFPAAQYAYLYKGYEYKVQFDWEDNDGNTLFTTDTWYYEGLWERHIEMYAQDVYVDNRYGSTVVLRVDSYCVQDPRCPGENEYIYPCPIELISKTGITQLGYDVRYLDWIKDGSDCPDWSREYGNYGGGSYAEIRNLFTLNIGDPSNISGVTVDSATGNYLIPIGFQQIRQQNPLYMFQENDFVPSDGSLIQDVITVECRTHEATGYDRTAYGDIAITKDLFMSLPSAQTQLRTMLIKSVYRQQANSTADNYLTFCGAKVEVYSPESSLVYSAKVNPVDRENNMYGYQLTEEQFNTDDYIIDIECKREYAQVVGTNHGAPTNNIEIRFCHNHNYVEDRTYIVEVTPFGGITYQFNFTLKAADLSDGAVFYPKQYMNTSGPGSVYFGISGNHSGDSMDASQEESTYASNPRSNKGDITVTPVSESEVPATVSPLGGIDDQNLGISEPVRVSDSILVSWFRVDFPEVPYSSSDVYPNNTLVFVHDENILDNYWVFFGRQKK